MKTILLTAMVLVLLSIIWIIARAIVLRGKCLDDDEIRAFLKGQVANSSNEYQRMASHLGTCEKCQEQMRLIQFGKPLDEHLIEK